MSRRTAEADRSPARNSLSLRVWRDHMHTENTLVAQGLACWYKGRLIPVMRGADGRDEPLFDSIPENLSDPEIEDAELAALAASLRARVQEVLAGARDIEVVGDRTQSQVAEEMQQAVLAIESIDAELAARAEAEGEYDDTLSSLASRAGVSQTEEPEGGDGEGDGDQTDGTEDAEGDGEATTAAADAP